ncbi:MAG: hypothetical protein GXN98_03770 [Euryarchaeota archaeon]|nr:hypothetical protein [Euryarchaeota archaeon]
MQKRKEKVFLMTDVVGGLMQAIKQAKMLGDLESTRLASVYREQGMSTFSVPAFAISEVEVELKFAVAEPVEPARSSKAGVESMLPGLRVKISPETLSGLNPEMLSSMRIKFSPVDMKVFRE